MLALAADLHDRLTCACGCGGWLSETRDPHIQWDVSTEVCYRRKAIEAYTKVRDPGPHEVLTVKRAGVTESGASEFDDLLAQFPHLREPSLAPVAAEDEQPEHDGGEQTDEPQERLDV